MFESLAIIEFALAALLIMAALAWFLATYYVPSIKKMPFGILILMDLLFTICIILGIVLIHHGITDFKWNLRF